MDDLTPAAGVELADLRRMYGLTQAQVAAALGIARVTVANWEADAIVPAIKAARYRRAAATAARAAMMGTAELTMIDGAPA